MAIRDEFLHLNARAIRFGHVDLAPPAWVLASPLLSKSALKPSCRVVNTNHSIIGGGVDACAEV